MMVRGHTSYFSGIGHVGPCGNKGDGHEWHFASVAGAMWSGKLSPQRFIIGGSADET